MTTFAKRPPAEVHPIFAGILNAHGMTPPDDQCECDGFYDPLTHDEECDCRECLEYPNHRRSRYYPKLR